MNNNKPELGKLINLKEYVIKNKAYNTYLTLLNSGGTYNPHNATKLTLSSAEEVLTAHSLVTNGLEIIELNQAIEDYNKLTREDLASLQHDIWSHWMKYQWSVCTANEDGTFTIPADKVKRWTRQINTPYSDLTDKEQESDRHQADKVIELLLNKQNN